MIIKQYVGVIVVLAMMLGVVCGCAGPSDKEAQLDAVALQIQKAVQSKLDTLDGDLAAASSKLSRTGLSGSETRQILNELCRNNSFVIDSCTADTAGKMVTMVPEAYSKYEGSDISKQDPTIKFQATKKPTLSPVFKAVEGFDAVVLMQPVVSEKGDFIGSVSVLFKPETLFASVVEPAVKGKDIEVTVIQLDGLDVYDSGGVDTGKNLFTDPLYQPYKELISLGIKMVAQESGTGSYTFLNHAGQTVKKQAFWVSVGLHGTMWRMASIIGVGN